MNQRIFTSIGEVSEFLNELCPELQDWQVTLLAMEIINQQKRIAELNQKVKDYKEALTDTQLWMIENEKN